MSTIEVSADGHVHWGFYLVHVHGIGPWGKSLPSVGELLGIVLKSSKVLRGLRPGCSHSQSVKASHTTNLK